MRDEYKPILAKHPCQLCRAPAEMVRWAREKLYYVCNHPACQKRLDVISGWAETNNFQTIKKAVVLK